MLYRLSFAANYNSILKVLPPAAPPPNSRLTSHHFRDFVGEKIGKISFDFVKLTQDKSKIFVAIRFEKRDEAKEFMET